jgi:hypothetical protein
MNPPLHTDGAAAQLCQRPPLQWARIISIQFQGIDGHDLDQFRDWSRQVVVYPSQYQSGKLVYPLQ